MALSRASRQYLGVRALLPPDLQYATRNPTSSDKAYVKGTLWLNTASATAFMWPGTGDWISLGSGTTGALITLTGNTGGALSPTGGNINILGGSGVTVTGSGSTLTISLTGGGVAIDSFAPDAGTNPVVPSALGLVTMAGTANQITTTGGLNSLTFSVPSTFIAPGTIASTTTITAGTALVATTSVTAGTTITATLGAITASNGNVVLNTAGNGLRVKSGSNARIGVGAVLSGGTLAVSNTSVSANTVVLISVTTLGTVTAAQAMHVTKSAGVGFTVTSADATDTSTFDWYLVEAI